MDGLLESYVIPGARVSQIWRQLARASAEKSKWKCIDVGSTPPFTVMPGPVFALVKTAVNVVGVMAVTVTISPLEPSELATVRAVPTTMSVMAAGVTV